LIILSDLEVAVIVFANQYGHQVEDVSYVIDLKRAIVDALYGFVEHTLPS